MLKLIKNLAYLLLQTHQRNIQSALGKVEGRTQFRKCVLCINTILKIIKKNENDSSNIPTFDRHTHKKFF